MNDGPRYQALKRFRSHFISTVDVVDTMKMDEWNHYEVIAECEGLETAQAIALALNRSAE